MKYPYLKLLKSRQVKIKERIQLLKLVPNKDYIHKIWDGYRYLKKRCSKVIGKKSL